MPKTLHKLFEPDQWRERLLDNEVEALRRIVQDLVLRVQRNERYACPVCQTLLKQLKNDQDASAQAVLAPTKE